MRYLRPCLTHKNMKDHDHAIGRRHDYNTQRRDDVRRYIEENPTKTYEEVGEHFGVSRTIIQRYMRDLGLSRRPVHRRVREKVDLLRLFIETEGWEQGDWDDPDLLKLVRDHDELVKSGKREF